jgi:predicted nuclease of predicted toxin-antitoxin system
LIVVTLDADFHTLLAASGAISPSVIRLRRQRLNGQQAAAIITAVLERSHQALEAGAVASVTSALIRVKLLPLPQPRQRSSHR